MNLQGRSDVYDTPITDIPASDTDDVGAHLRAVLSMLWRGRWIVLAAVLLAGGFGLLAISQMTPTYSASARMLFIRSAPNITDIREVVLAAPTQGSLTNEVEILRSTSLLGAVADRLGLADHVAARARPRSFRLAHLFDWRTYVSSETLAGLGLVDPPASLSPTDAASVERRRRLAAVAFLRAGLSLRPVGDSRVLVVTFTGDSAALAARIVNAVTQEYVDSQLATKADATRQASEWLAERIDTLRGRVETAELAVEEARTKLAAQAGQTSEITQQQLRETNRALAEARAELARLDVRYRAAEAALAAKGRDLGAVSMFREAPVIQQLRAKQSELLDREAALAAFARDNPNRVRIRAELERIEQAIRAEAERIVSALATDVDVATRRVEVLERQVARLELIEQGQRRGEVRLRQLEREAEAGRVLFESFLARLEETQQQQTLLSVDARILSPAETPSAPENAGKKRILVLALAIGFCAGVGAVFLLDKLNDTFRGVTQIEDQTGLPVLAVLPTIGNDSERAEVIEQLYEKPNGRLAEAVRNLRTSLLFGSIKAPPKVVVVTSSVPGEGKSTTALLLALTSQQMGRSAIIVDCDMRLRALSSLIDHEDTRPGLLSVLKGTAKVEDAVDVDPNTGLMMLGVRPGEIDHTLSAADIVASRYFGDLVTHLGKVFDLVVLDTPPVLVVTDARIAASLADAIVYAVRWDETPRGAVQEGLRELRSMDAPIAGIALTMVDSERVASYAYETYGHYRARYSEYYF